MGRGWAGGQGLGAGGREGARPGVFCSLPILESPRPWRDSAGISTCVMTQQPPNTHPKIKAFFLLAGLRLPERACSQSWGPVPSPKTHWRKGSGSLQTPGTTRLNEVGENRSPGKGMRFHQGPRRSKPRPEAPSPSRTLSPEPAPPTRGLLAGPPAAARTLLKARGPVPGPRTSPGYEPDVRVASDERLQVPPDVVLVSLAHYVSHARDSLVQPRGFGALRRRRRGGPPPTPAPFPLPPAAPRLVTRLAPCSHYLGPTRTASHPADWVRVRVPRLRVPLPSPQHGAGEAFRVCSGG